MEDIYSTLNYRHGDIETAERKVEGEIQLNISQYKIHHKRSMSDQDFLRPQQYGYEYRICNLCDWMFVTCAMGYLVLQTYRPPARLIQDLPSAYHLASHLKVGIILSSPTTRDFLQCNITDPSSRQACL